MVTTTTTTPTTTMSTDGKIIKTKLSAISRNQRCTTNYSLLWLSLSCDPPRWRSFTFARAHIQSDRSEYSWQSSWWTWLDIRNEHAEPEEPIGWLAILIGEWYWSFTVEILWIKPLNRWEFEYNRNIMCREDHSVAGRTSIAVIGQFVDVVDYLAEYSKCVFFLLNNFFSFATIITETGVNSTIIALCALHSGDDCDTDNDDNNNTIGVSQVNVHGVGPNHYHCRWSILGYLLTNEMLFGTVGIVTTAGPTDWFTGWSINVWSVSWFLAIDEHWCLCFVSVRQMWSFATERFLIQFKTRQRKIATEKINWIFFQVFFFWKKTQRASRGVGQLMLHWVFVRDSRIGFHCIHWSVTRLSCGEILNLLLLFGSVFVSVIFPSCGCSVLNRWRCKVCYCRVCFRPSATFRRQHCCCWHCWADICCNRRCVGDAWRSWWPKYLDRCLCRLLEIRWKLISAMKVISFSFLFVVWAFVLVDLKHFSWNSPRDGVNYPPFDIWAEPFGALTSISYFNKFVLFTKIHQNRMGWHSNFIKLFAWVISDSPFRMQSWLFRAGN